MQSLFLHKISVVRVYLSMAATTQDPAGQDPHQKNPSLYIEHYFIYLLSFMLYEPWIIRQVEAAESFNSSHS